MSRRNFARLAILLCALTSAGTSARADDAGCAVLAEWVKAAVAAATGRRDPELFDGPGTGSRLRPTPSGRYTCSATAAVASRAFGEALRALNLRVAWNGDWTGSGGYCLGHDLDQCHPSHDRFSALPPPDEFAFVQRTWRDLRRALASQMPFGFVGDLSSFNDASLDAALSTELGTFVSGSSRNAVRNDRRLAIQSGLR